MKPMCMDCWLQHFDRAPILSPSIAVEDCFICGQPATDRIFVSEEFAGKIFQHPEPEKRCKECGCTESNACVHQEGSTCSWVSPGLCSACAPDALLGGWIHGPARSRTESRERSELTISRPTIWEDPIIIEAAKERSWDEIAIMECPECSCYSYYNDGTGPNPNIFTCRICKQAFFVMDEEDEDWPEGKCMGTDSLTSLGQLAIREDLAP